MTYENLMRNDMELFELMLVRNDYTGLAKAVSIVGTEAVRALFSWGFRPSDINGRLVKWCPERMNPEKFFASLKNPVKADICFTVFGNCETVMLPVWKGRVSDTIDAASSGGLELIEARFLRF